ncbi:MAG: inorganic phosphate transporter [Spirochaetales bacterium]|nr:inorganic phosphate transporter [Spirochaetales bacterium]
MLLFLSSGLFLGWSLGANDAANVWGTAVGTRMVRFRTAAFICALFVIAGAVAGGSGGAETLGKLAAIPTIAGAFTVALAAALSVFLMTKAALPVSTSQAIVGALLGWTFFARKPVDFAVLGRIMGTWVFSPILTALLSILLYFGVRFVLARVRVHLIRMDALTRFLLIGAGAFGSYSLGANNIANVMGVFVPSQIFPNVNLGVVEITGVQLLFGLGGLSIALGVFTYSKQVMTTVGSEIYRLNPVTAFIVVLSSAIVLFLFASEGLQEAMRSVGLPTFPLVPVSSSQSIVGGVIGIGVAQGGHNIRYGVLGRIALGWLATPVIAALVAFVVLYVMQNVFALSVL